MKPTYIYENGHLRYMCATTNIYVALLHMGSDIYIVPQSQPFFVLTRTSPATSQTPSPKSNKK